MRRKFTKTIKNDIGKTVIATCRQMVGNASLPWLRMAAVASIAIAMNVNADAQCNVFKNADAANPLLSVIPAGKKIAGFAFADIDGDGDQDVYVSYENGTYPPKRDVLHLFRNIGNKEHPVFKEDTNTGFGNLKAAYQNPFMQFVDIDGDGDLDYYASEDAEGYYDFGAIVYAENIGTATVPKFKIGGDDPTPYISSHVYQPFAFADVDGDGDLDLYVADESNGYGFSYYQRIYYNSGTKKKGVFDLDNYFLNTIDQNTNRTYYDWNKDGLLDFFGVEYNGAEYIKNVGSINKPRYVNAQDEDPTFKNGSPYRMIDLNNDGAAEVFDFAGHYSTLAPVAVIEDSVISTGNKMVRVLSSVNRGASYLYRWEFNGKTISGATQYYIPATKAGIYTLYVTDECGTGVSLNYTVTKNGVPIEQANDRIAAMSNEFASPVEVKSYPNPFTSSFTLQLSSVSNRTESMVRITDLAGRVFLSQRMSASTVALGQRLSQGAYIVQVWQRSELVYHTIMLKQ